MNINQQSDNILIQLKQQSEKEKATKDSKTKYKIPTGGFFDYVSSANYWGEIVEWTGLMIIANFNIGKFDNKLSL